MDEKKHYLHMNKATGQLEFRDFPYPEKEKELLDFIYAEYAFEPLDRTTLERMNKSVHEKLEDRP